MTPPTLTDRAALARARARAHEFFLHEEAVADVQERLSVVNRRFTKLAIVTGHPAPWARAFPEATVVPDDEVLALPGMPSEMTLYRCLAEEPEFAQQYRMAREVQAHRRFDMAWEAARHARWDGWRGAKLFIDTIRWQLAMLAPEAYGPPPRGADEPEPPEVRVEVVRFFDDEPDPAIGSNP